MMKLKTLSIFIALALLCTGVSAQIYKGRYFTPIKSPYVWDFGKFDKGLILPTDTTTIKYGIAQFGKKIFVGNDTVWTEIAGGSGGLDSVFINTTRRFASLDLTKWRKTTNETSQELVTDILDSFTGEPVSLTKATTFNGVTIVDGYVDSVLIFKNGSDYYIRNITSDIDGKIYGLTGDSTTDNRVNLQKAATAGNRFKKAVIIPAAAKEYYVSGTLTLDSLVLRAEPGAILRPTTISGGVIDIPATQVWIKGDPTFTNVKTTIGGFSVRWPGAKGDGTTNDNAAFARAVQWASGNNKNIIIPQGNYSIGTINFNYQILTFLPGGMLTGTINNVGGIVADYQQQIFATSSTFTNILTSGKFSVKWLGALGNGSTDDATAINKINPTTVRSRAIIFPRSTGKYVINSSITFNAVDGGSTYQYKTLYFEEGACLTSTNSAGQFVGATINADKNYKIADTSFTFNSCRPSDDLWSLAWQADEVSASTDNTKAFNKAVAAINQRYTLYIPAREFRIDGPKVNCRVQGAGRGSILKYATGGTTGNILTITRHTLQGDVGLIELGNFVVDGTSSNCYGIEFDSTDIYSGRYRFKDIVVTNCVRSVNKTFGNFGNVWDGCTFQSSDGLTDFHYYVMDYSLMHGGLDDFKNCRFQGANKAAVYIHDEEGGGFTFEKCVFEYNKGFDIFCKVNGANQSIVPTIFKQCWLEGDLKTFPVVIDGVTYSQAYEFYFIQTNNFIFENSTLGRMAVTNNSYVRINGGSHAYHYGQIPTYIDSTSMVEVVESPTCYNCGTYDRHVSENGLRFQPRATSAVRTPFPKNLVPVYDTALRVSVEFDTIPATTSSITKTLMQGGQFLDSFIRVSNVLAGTYFSAANVNMAADKWYVTSIGFRWVSGGRVLLQQVGASSGMSIDTNNEIAKGEWGYWWFIRKAPTTTTTGLFINASTASDAVFDVSCYQHLVFDTYQQAAQFVKQNAYVSKKRWSKGGGTVINNNYSGGGSSGELITID